MGFLSLFSATRVSNPAFDRIFTFSDDILLQRYVDVVKTDRRRCNWIRFLAAQVYKRREAKGYDCGDGLKRIQNRSGEVLVSCCGRPEQEVIPHQLSFVVSKPQTYVLHSPPRLFECQLLKKYLVTPKARWCRVSALLSQMDDAFVREWTVFTP
jgi:hypothetical protein